MLDVPETDVPETDVPDVPETDVPETDAPDVPETDAPDVPETDAPERMAPRQRKTEMGVPEREGVFFKHCGRLLVGFTVSFALSGVYGSSDV